MRLTGKDLAAFFAHSGASAGPEYGPEARPGFADLDGQDFSLCMMANI
jgi:hypothetical protein